MNNNSSRTGRTTIATTIATAITTAVTTTKTKMLRTVKTNKEQAGRGSRSRKAPAFSKICLCSAGIKIYFPVIQESAAAYLKYE